MSNLRTMQTVSIEELGRALSEELGPKYKVSVSSPDTLKVGRSGVMPSKVVLCHDDGTTTFQVKTTGLFVSRLIQVFSVNPAVQRALTHRYPPS